MSRDLPDSPEYSLQGIRHHVERIADALEMARANVLPDEDRRLIRVGGIAVGLVVAREIRDDGRIIYEVEPLGPWKGFPAHPRQEVEA